MVAASYVEVLSIEQDCGARLWFSYVLLFFRVRVVSAMIIAGMGASVPGLPIVCLVTTETAPQELSTLIARGLLQSVD